MLFLFYKLVYMYITSQLPIYLYRSTLSPTDQIVLKNGTLMCRKLESQALFSNQKKSHGIILVTKETLIDHKQGPLVYIVICCETTVLLTCII